MSTFTPRTTLGRVTVSLIVLDWFMLVAGLATRARRRASLRRTAC